ncbi:MAG: UDP-N-acetylmuramoyl-L-alanyl-D-glutamate--2,6-diaminopimelate ligase [Gammaproteobacteria bacterium]
MMAMNNKTNSVMLSGLLSNWLEVPVIMDHIIHGITLDSRDVRPGYLFLACKGKTVNGTEFIDKAIAQGAVAVIWETNDSATAIPFNTRKSPQGNDIPVIALDGLSKKAGLIASRFFAEPSKQMFVTGITGTNGKTSCSHFLAQALNADETTGIIGTLGNGLYGQLETATHTTPDVVRCHQLLAEMLANGARNVAMEVSSHALDQGRVTGIDFDCAVFTNLSRDHLDYHGDMESYLESKLKLFSVPSLKFAVINNDEAVSEKIRAVISTPVKVITYGMKTNADVIATDIQLSHDGIKIKVTTPWGAGELKTSLLGRFNVSNLLAVLSVLLLKGIKFEDALQRLAKVQGVAGRMQCLQSNEKPLVVVDYAHTPDALEHVLSALQEHQHKQLWCVFGCGGDRDQGKRPMMGAIAERLADQLVITTDNPRSEDPQAIVNEISEGLSKASDAHIQLDRAEAIEYAINNASQEDIVLIAGKGHETYQEVNGKRYPFSDMETAKHYLEVRA